MGCGDDRLIALGTPEKRRSPIAVASLNNQLGPVSQLPIREVGNWQDRTTLIMR